MNSKLFWVITPCSSERDKSSRGMPPSWVSVYFVDGFYSFLAWLTFRPLKTDLIYSSETSMFLRTTCCYNPQDHDLRIYNKLLLKSIIHLILVPLYIWSTRWRSWLRHYATSRKVAGSIPDEVIGFFSWPNPSSCTMALGSTQPLTETSTRNIPGV
jgi:hypothetical protein